MNLGTGTRPTPHLLDLTAKSSRSWGCLAIGTDPGRVTGWIGVAVDREQLTADGACVRPGQEQHEFGDVCGVDELLDRLVDHGLTPYFVQERPLASARPCSTRSIRSPATAPGWMVLEVMPSLPSSMASVLAEPTSPRFVVEYAIRSG